MVKRLINAPELKPALRELRSAAPAERRAARQKHRRAEEIPADQVELVETVEYRGFTILVHKRLDRAPPFQFQPTIFKDGIEVRPIFVRSKTLTVSREHFAKRAIDAFLKTGRWPEKLGLTLPVAL
jgi:hypothetical protein